MDQVIRSRLRLALRGERVFGLEAIPVRLPETRGSAQAQSVRPAVDRSAGQAPPPVVEAPPEQLLPPPQSRPMTGPPLDRDQKVRLLQELDERQVKGCRRCRLCETRTHTVFGEGDPDAELVFVGEGPGETEDLQGRPFVGRAGKKLDEMIAAMGLRREQVYICNVVKCRPPQNRAPAPDETEACTPFLERQLEIIRPRVIVTLGLPATRWITGSSQSMGRMRGQWQEYRGIRVMPTFHPSYILRVYTPEVRGAVWSDLQKVMLELKLSPPRGTGA